MIPSSLPMKALACTVATVSVVSAAVYLSPDQNAKIDAAGVMVATTYGTSFADMSQGTLMAEPVETMLTAEQTPVLAKTIEATTIVPVEKISPARVETPQKAVQPTNPLSTIAAAPVALSPSPRAEPLDATAPITPPLKAAPTASAATPKVPSASIIEQTGPAPRLSRRPKLRDPAKAPLREVERMSASKPKAQSQRGNAPRDANRGTTKATTQTARAAPQGNQGQQSQPGNAAVSNYSGKVISCVAKVPKPNAKGVGAAVVAFSVASNGALKDVRIARSSGIASLDTAALAMIRRASPCAPPPQGAKRHFSFTIRGE